MDKYGFRKINKPLAGELVRACEDNDFDLAKMLVDEGADVDDKGNLADNTALMEASNHGNLAIVQMLINKGADTNKRDTSGFTALILASAGGKNEVVNLLLEKGARLDDKNKWGMTALMWACRNNKVDTVKLLAAKVARLDDKNADGLTAADCAENSEHRDIIVKVLEEEMQRRLSPALRRPLAVKLPPKLGGRS